jgi:hypothetical protein
MDNIIQRWAPIAISVLSFILSGIALGWNVYRDVILKARVKVSVNVVRVVSQGQRVGQGDQFIGIGVTNHGPGPVRAEMIVGRRTGFWRRLSRRTQHFVILADHTNPLNPKLPVKMEVGDSISLMLPYNESSFLNGAGTHIGISDSFGRSHFAPGKQLLAAKAQFTKDFPEAKKRQDV